MKVSYLGREGSVYSLNLISNRDFSLQQRSVESTVAVRSLAQLVLLIQNKLAFVSETRQHELFEKNNIIAIQTEIVVRLEIRNG